MNSVDRSGYIIGLTGLATGCVVGALIASQFSSKDTNGEQTNTNLSESTTHHNKRSFLNETDDAFASLSKTSILNSTIDYTINYTGYSAQANFPNVSKNKTLMGRHLTRDLYDNYFDKQTIYKTSLDMCVQAGLDNPDKMSCGLVAGDELCYDTFSKIFDPVIADRHYGFTRENAIGFGKKILDLKNKLEVQPFDTNYVKSVHFLVGRCVRGYRFPPTCSRAERHDTEELLKTTLESLQDDYAGKYYHLPDLDLVDLQGLPDILQSVAICPTSSTMKSSGALRDWPHGRGVYYSTDRKLFAWTNREDHVRLMYRVRDDKILDFMQAYKSFSDCLSSVESILKDKGAEFAHHKEFGYLLTCPSGIGTAMRAGANVHLPRLMMDSRFRSILKELRLHIGTEDAGSMKRGFIDIYNMDRLGFTEEELVQHVAGAINLLVGMEKRLEYGDQIDDLIPKNMASKNKN